MTKRRLSLLLVLFFLALALPTSILVYQAYGQLKWEAFHQHQQLARELTLRIDSGFSELIRREENRSISDYEFLNVTGSDGTGFLQRSPLSDFPLVSDVPGLLGYFQVDASGQLRTPIVPADNAAHYGISVNELQQREQQEGRIRGILDQNRLVSKSDVMAPAMEATEGEAEEVRVDSNFKSLELDRLASGVVSDDRDTQGQSVFDELTARKLAPAESSVVTEQVKDLKLKDSYEVAASIETKLQPLEAQKKSEVKAKRSRKEQVNLPQTLGEQAFSP